MKRVCAIVVVVAAGLGTLEAQEATESIRQLLHAQVVAWNEGNLDGYMSGYWKSESTLFVSGGTTLRGYDEVFARYRRGYDTRDKMGKLEFGELSIRPLSSDLALATGTWKLTRAADQPWGRFTLLLHKKPDGWRIVYDHTSSAERD
jgi:ketosteroid isomerase-like protein